jgi:Concanavalin A-like lectin/glucanases superfamily
MKKLILYICFSIIQCAIFAQNHKVLDLNFNGNIIDGTGYNTVYAANTPNYVAGINGVANTAIHFNGINDYLWMTDNANLHLTEGFTIYALVRPTGLYPGTCHVNFILSKGKPAALGHYGLFYSDDPYIKSKNVNTSACAVPLTADSLLFIGSRNDADVNFSAPEQNTPALVYTQSQSTTIYNDYVNFVGPIKLNNWYCVVYNYDKKANVSKLYVNGLLVATNSWANTFNDYNTDDLYIGRTLDPDYLSYSYWLNGDVDELRIYDTVYNSGNLKNSIPEGNSVCKFALPINDKKKLNSNNITIASTNESVIINFNNYSNSKTVLKLYSVDGKIIKEFSLNKYQDILKLDKNEFNKGIYLISIFEENKNIYNSKIAL